MLAPLRDPSLTSTERYSSSAALLDPDRATRAFYKFCRRTTTPLVGPYAHFRALSCEQGALRDPGGLLALALPSRTAWYSSDWARASRRRRLFGAPLEASCTTYAAHGSRGRGAAESQRSPRGAANREQLRARQPIAMAPTQVPKGLGCRAVRGQNEAHAHHAPVAAQRHASTYATAQPRHSGGRLPLNQLCNHCPQTP